MIDRVKTCHCCHWKRNILISRHIKGKGRGRYCPVMWMGCCLVTVVMFLNKNYGIITNFNAGWVTLVIPTEPGGSLGGHLVRIPTPRVPLPGPDLARGRGIGRVCDLVRVPTPYPPPPPPAGPGQDVPCSPASQIPVKTLSSLVVLRGR